ncbi:hypothetical protein [Nocardia gipuzkoensis]
MNRVDLVEALGQQRLEERRRVHIRQRDRRDITTVERGFGVGGQHPASQTHAAEALVYDRLDRLVKLRNRSAHMEPLLGANIPGRLSDCMHLLGYVSPHTRDWCTGMSRVTAINNARPQP